METDHSEKVHRSNQDHHRHQSKDHEQHHGHMVKDFRKRFWISMILTIPILILSPMIQDLLGFSFSFTGSNYLQFLLSSIVYFYGGWPFLTGFFNEIKDKRPGMMTLIAVAITVAWGYSSAITLGLQGRTFFWELATLIDIMLLGHWLEMKSVIGASRSLQKLVEMMPSEAHRLKNGDTEEVSVDQLKKKRPGSGPTG